MSKIITKQSLPAKEYFTNYFGVRLVTKKDGFKLNKENYIKVSNKSSFFAGETYDKEWCEKHVINCLKNYDLNMEYFKTLDKNEFNIQIDNFLLNNSKFKQVNNLSEYDNVGGYYIMVLDEYCQVYIGTADNIKRRIMNHWSKQKQFDRLIFGNINNSILSIDSFRAFDTTRIYVKPSKSLYLLENSVIKKFPKEFVINRTSGGRLEGLSEAIINRKMRQLKKP